MQLQCRTGKTSKWIIRYQGFLWESHKISIFRGFSIEGKNPYCGHSGPSGAVGKPYNC